MSLFVCEECGCIENTALCGFWLRKTKDGSGRALCSECDPQTGKWHGRFPKDQYDPKVHKPHWIDGGWVREDG